ncbi:MAG TPA: hypothetical protein VHE14_06675 [Solirubrobacteraceae bacterium]|nr:hypothetical protein [Solirubrobacteraceae bacterium]
MDDAVGASLTVGAEAATDSATALYGRRARVLAVGIAATGLVTFAYFGLAAHALGRTEYGRISLLWSVMFVIVSVIYRPIEQLLSRTIAERRARGLDRAHPLRVPAAIQLAFALAFLLTALALRDQLQHDLFGGSSTLYWILVVGVLAYAASYFARGWLAGHERFGLYGGLVLLESMSRFCFPLAVTVGIVSGQTAVALGIAAAPFVSLLVVPVAFARRAALGDEGPAAAPRRVRPGSELSLAGGGTFAAAVLGIMLAEQALLNAAALVVNATANDAALAGFVFNVLLIARAPLQLFQSIQTSLLPHLAGLHATEDDADFGRAIRVTVAVICGFTSIVTLGLLAVGPWAMRLAFTSHFHYQRGGLVLVGIGMGFHLIAGTLNQAALARSRAGLAAAAWLLSAALFVGWLALPTVSDQVLRVELGYFGATGILAALLFALYRRPVAPVV